VPPKKSPSSKLLGYFQTIPNMQVRKCKTCDEEMIQKNRWRLFIVGVLMVTSLTIAAYVPLFWAPGIVLLLTGCYLIIWATLGKGYWCRACKRFGTF
jgi:hypothetical protein